MVPTTSTSMSLLLGDCLATTVMNIKKFSKEKFKIFHPGCNIGQSLLLAKDIMITGSKMPVIDLNRNFNQALKVMSQKKLGIVVITKNKLIKGIVTDGDLRRELNKNLFNKNLKKLITKNPLVVSEDISASKALAVMNENKITSLLVIPRKNT